MLKNMLQICGGGAGGMQRGWPFGGGGEKGSKGEERSTQGRKTLGGAPCSAGRAWARLRKGKMALLLVEWLGAGLAAAGAALLSSGEYLTGEGLELASAYVGMPMEFANSAFNWYSGLTLMQRGPFIVVQYVIVLTSVVFLIPAVIKWFMGGSLLIDRIAPAPKGVFISDVPAASFQRMECINPANGELLGYVAAMNKAEVNRRVERARKAQQIWVKTSFKERRRVLRLILTYILQYQDEIVRMSCEDSGKTVVDSMFGDILNTLAKIQWVIDEGEKVLKPSVRKAQGLLLHRHSEVQYEPLGVIGAIQPWNYPFHNFMNTIISGIFAGNAVVVKVSEFTGWSGAYYCHIVQEILRQAGHPMELVDIITGDLEAGEAFVESPIDKLFFTGSTTVGKLVAKSAAERLLPVELELGGKDPLVVCNDTNLKRAVQFVLRGVFQNSGQNCIGAERIFVQEDIHDEFVSMLKEAISKLRVGDYRDLVGKVDLGAMTMGQKALFHIQELVNDAVMNGAELLHGGQKFKFTPKGTFYTPTLLTNAKPDMRIAREEVFGPVALVFKFTDDDQCLKIINDNPFGLSSSVFVNSSARADKYIKGIRAGMITINDFGTNYVNQGLPFGGTKDSGYGRFAGVEGLRGCCMMKTVTRDKFPFICTNIPKQVQYPVMESGPDFVKEFLYAGYGYNIFLKIAAFRNLCYMALFKSFRPTPREMDKYLAECVDNDRLMAEMDDDDPEEQEEPGRSEAAS